MAEIQNLVGFGGRAEGPGYLNTWALRSIQYEIAQEGTAVLIDFSSRQKEDTGTQRDGEFVGMRKWK